MRKTLRPVAFCSLLAFGLLVTSVWAKNRDPRNEFFLLPGVNAAGALDNSLGGLFDLRYVVNTKTKRFTGGGKGQVQNLSGEKQRFDNAPIFVAEITSNRYTVKVNGQCSVTFSGAFQSAP